MSSPEQGVPVAPSLEPALESSGIHWQPVEERGRIIKSEGGSVKRARAVQLRREAGGEAVLPCKPRKFGLRLPLRMLPDNVTQKLQGLAAGPGCYLFRDKQGEVLYVGKAKSLRSRVRSYFQDSSGDSRAFIPFLRKSIGDLETIVTASEKEAAILENSLIKEHKPRFNVKLRDDKEYLNLRLSSEHPWPRLDLVRRPEPDKARYFGPYHSATAARRTLHLV